MILPEPHYISNKGRGPLRACISSISDGIATMIRWDSRKPIDRQRLARFELPTHFLLLSDSCGWRRVDEPAPKRRKAKGGVK